MIPLKKPLSRRTMLRAGGVAMSLPFLEAMLPPLATAAPVSSLVRWAGLYFPCGTSGAWMPTGTGANWTPSNVLMPLDVVRADISVLTGIGVVDGYHHPGFVPGFMTGIRSGTGGAPFKAAVTIDQVIASGLATPTKLKLITSAPAGTGPTEDGQSGVYGSNLSWVDASTPAPRTTDINDLFEQIFAAGSGGPLTEDEQREAAQRAALRLSILDYVKGDAQRLSTRVGSADRATMDRYLTSVRELEVGIQTAGNSVPMVSCGSATAPAVTGEHEADTKTKLDLIALAFQCNATRVATHLFDFEFSGRDVSDFVPGESGGHHSRSHYGGDPTSDAAVQYDKIPAFYMRMFAYFVQKLKSIPEVGGTLLDNTMAVVATGHCNAHAHSYDTDVTHIVAGRGGGALNPGRAIAYPPRTKSVKIHVNALQIMGVQPASFGGETEGLSGL